MGSDMERTPLLRIPNRVKSWINPKNFNVQELRYLLMGNVIDSTIGEISAYKLLFQDVKGGELPSYVPVILIAVMSALEAIVTPFVSWLGFRKRRYVLSTYTLVVLLSTILLYFLPSAAIREESELCDAANFNNDISYRGMSARSIVRLTIIIMVTMTFQLSRVSSWSHGLAYCDEYAPERTSVHFGVLLLGRVVILMLANTMVAGMLTDLLPIQVSLLVFDYLCNLVQLFCVVPKHAPKVNGVQKTELPLLGRGFPLSISRVMSCSLVFLLALAASLLTAALWGIGYNRDDIVKVKFLMPASRSMSMSMIFEVWLRHAFIVMPIVLAGVKFSTPVLLEYCRRKALKQAVFMTTLAFIFFVLFTVIPKCDQGSVVGLGDDYYNYPECSLSCGCKPKWGEFNPVCATETMTTYLSPCQAGCSGTENINGIQVYTGCSCASIAGAGAVLPGACTTDCKQQYILHDTLFIVATTFTHPHDVRRIWKYKSADWDEMRHFFASYPWRQICFSSEDPSSCADAITDVVYQAMEYFIPFAVLALQAQGVLILKVVDPRDKSVAIGLLLSMVAVVTFVCGHLMFFAIRVTTCRWYQGRECHLQTAKFPYLVGFCSSFLVLLSALISIACFVLHKKSLEYERIDDVR